MRRTLLKGVFVIVSVLLLSVTSFAQEVGTSVDRMMNRELPDIIKELKLFSPLQVNDINPETLDPCPCNNAGPKKVIIRLKIDSVAKAKGKGKAIGKAKKDVDAQQQDFLSRVFSVDPEARVIARVQIVLNAVFVEVDASVLPVLANDSAVLHIVPVQNYEMELSETVPYIGASAVQNAGFDGTGVSVAVLDTGVDYTHASLGGLGDPDDYTNNNPDIIEPGTFPTAKVIGGVDFVGDLWQPISSDPDYYPFLEPDPDPLDKPTVVSHGTHVADIIGGVYGVAPGADIYAVKVCSSVSNWCSGIALIQGMEYAVDPDGDGDPADHLDIINMSLGSNYGNPFDDELSFAVNNASSLGVLTVASAGNSSDKPYVSGTPASAETALSVAETNVPSAMQAKMDIWVQTINGDSFMGSYDAIHQSWSEPLSAIIKATVQYGDGYGNKLNGCGDTFPAGSLNGKIVLVDRGDCNFTKKISNISQGGGLIGIIGLVAPGDPFAGGDGGDRPIDIPGYMISQETSEFIKYLLTWYGDSVKIEFNPAAGDPLVAHMVGASSRGPAVESNMIKPEIGAPGASVSAIAGTGYGTGAFGGTSGAAPMVSGSAALLLQAYPDRSPNEIKAVLMNTGEINIKNKLDGGLAPISRIGGGEVRVDQAISAPAAAWDNDMPSGALNFGFVDVSKKTMTLKKTVRIRNYSEQDVNYNISSTFRFDDDETNGAVSLHTPKKVKVKARKDKISKKGKGKVKAGKDITFKVTLTINGEMLRNNRMNSGADGANGDALTKNEYDGYIILDDGSQPIHLAWHVLPRKAAKIKGHTKKLKFKKNDFDSINLTNSGVGTAQNDAYTLIAMSSDIPEGGPGEQSPTPDIRGIGVNTFSVPAGYCSAEPSFVWAFAVNTWERQTRAEVPVSHEFRLDTDQDGWDDYVVLNQDFAFDGTLSDGRSVTWAVDLSTGIASAFFYTEHATNTGNTVLRICGEQVGLTGTDMLETNVDVTVIARDFYYGGPYDSVDGLTITPLGEGYFGIPIDIPGKSKGIPDESKGVLWAIDFGPFPGNTPELGLMLFANGDRGPGNHGGATEDTEAIFITAH